MLSAIAQRGAENENADNIIRQPKCSWPGRPLTIPGSDKTFDRDGIAQIAFWASMTRCACEAACPMTTEHVPGIINWSGKKISHRNRLCLKPLLQGGGEPEISYSTIYIQRRVMEENSPGIIVLDPDEKEALTTAARRHTSPYCAVVCAKAILLAADGLTDRQIGDRLDLPRAIVAKWRERFVRRRLSGLRAVPGDPWTERG